MQTASGLLLPNSVGHEIALPRVEFPRLLRGLGDALDRRLSAMMPLAGMLGPLAAGSRVATPSSLLTGIVAYWKLDEVSNGSIAVTRADATTRGNTLSDPATTPSASGLISNAGSFAAASSRYLSLAGTTPDAQMGDIDFTIAAWLYPTAAINMMVVTKDGAGGGKRDYMLNCNCVNMVAGFEVFRPIDSSRAAGGVSIASLNQWYLLVGWHDATANTVNLQVNNGTVKTTATGGALQAASDSEFRIGARVYTGSPLYTTGLIDEVGVWKRVLTPAERTTLYNSGNGITYPFS